MESYTIIGTQNVSFTSKDNQLIEGMNIFCSTPIPPSKGTGNSAEKFFFSKKLLGTMSYQPKVGDEVEILFSRYGKPYLIRPILQID